MKKNYIIYFLLLVYFFLSNYILIPMNIPYYTGLLNPLIWLSISGISYYLSMDSGLRIKANREKTQSLLISLIIYIIVYFLLGLVFGFERTPYSKEPISIIKNFWTFGSIIIFEELVRQSIIKNEKKKWINYIAVTFIFILFNLNVNSFLSNFSDIKTAFIYVSTTLIPTILESIMLTYLVRIGGAKDSIIYRMFTTMPAFIAPIIPDLDWFGTAIMGVTLPIAVFIYLNYVHVIKTERFSRREKKKYSPAVYIPIFGVIAVLAGFVIGIFKYQPIAVVSGSMSPTFNRGDAVVIRKLNTQEKNKLEKGDIIQFVSGTKYVIHRIVSVTNDEYGNKLFVTKGDYNNANDSDKVHMQDIKGKVSFVIPYIGYPSVWLSGAIS